jgi:hypothetical protein
MKIAFTLLLVMGMVGPFIGAEELGTFTAASDVGKVGSPGKASFDPASKQYKISAAGENMWKTEDAFHFVHKPATTDMTLTADVAFEGEGKNAHRKGGVIIRQGLDADAPYVDVVVHGDGSIGFQYRKEKGGITESVKPDVKAPVTIKLERRGDTFTGYVAEKGKEFAKIGSIELKLTGPTYAGLAVCSHDVKVTETAVFSNVTVSEGKN